MVGDCGKKGAIMSARQGRRPPSPLTATTLHELALAYVGRFATTRGKLRTYLSRKLRERGWEGTGDPEVVALADRFAERGLIDDAGYALVKAQGLTQRGYGKRRVTQTLRAAGVAEQDGAAAEAHSDAEALTAALRFAERRRLGPFAAAAASDPKVREKAIAALMRAGHGFGVARAIVRLEPGAEIDRAALGEQAGLRSG
jgi:regulatory protein